MKLLPHWLLALSLLLAACEPAQGTEIPTPAPRTATVANTEALPTEAGSTEVQPTATTDPATATPVPATATPVPSGDPIAHLAPGTPVTVTNLSMLDAATGWAIGGARTLGDHVLRTTDGGETWADVTPPEPVVPVTDFGLATDAHGHFPDAERAWVVYGVSEITEPTAIPVWRTEDAGASWTASEPIDTSELGVGDFFAPSDLHFVDAQHGWFMAHLGVGMNHDYIAIYATSDGGETWAPVMGPQGEGPQSCGKTGLVFVDAQNGWLTGDCQGVAPGLFLYRTSDGGATWQPAELPPPESAPDIFTRQDAGCGTNSLTFLDEQTAKLAVACLILSTEPIETLAFVYTTTDGGESWTSSPAPSRGLTFVNPQVGWSLPLTSGFNNPPFDLSATTDGGATWTTVAEVDWYGQPDFVDPQTGWAVAVTTADRTFVRTTDGGATWETLAPTIAP